MPAVMAEELGEVALVHLASHGNTDALAALFDRHSDAVYRVAYRILGSREDAEDTVQDVFVGLPRALARYEEANKFADWLARVATRTALARLRAIRRSGTREQRAVLPLATGHDEALRITLNDALATLSPALRDVAVLRLAAGYTHEEVAAFLDISVSASKIRLHRAVKHLQTILRGSL